MRPGTWIILSALTVASIGAAGVVVVQSGQEQATMTAEQIDDLQLMLDSMSSQATLQPKGESRVCTYGPYEITLYYECPDEDPLADFRQGLAPQAQSIEPIRPETIRCYYGRGKSDWLPFPGDRCPSGTSADRKTAPANVDLRQPAIPENPTATESSQTSNCTPGYDPCLPPASDYDCRGGTGDGPAYTGRVFVTGPDIYRLDSDRDGVGCE